MSTQCLPFVYYEICLSFVRVNQKYVLKNSDVRGKALWTAPIFARVLGHPIICVNSLNKTNIPSARANEGLLLIKVTNINESFFVVANIHTWGSLRGRSYIT